MVGVGGEKVGRGDRGDGRAVGVGEAVDGGRLAVALVPLVWKEKVKSCNGVFYLCLTGHGFDPESFNIFLSGCALFRCFR